MQGRRDERDALDKGYLEVSYFSNSVGKIPLTYHSELMDEDPALFRVGRRTWRRDWFDFTASHSGCCGYYTKQNHILLVLTHPLNSTS